MTGISPRHLDAHWPGTSFIACNETIPVGAAAYGAGDWARAHRYEPHVDSQQIDARDELEKLRSLVRSLDQEGDQRALLGGWTARRLRSRRSSRCPWSLGGDGPAAELLGDVRIAPLELALEKDWLSDPELRHVMGPPERFADLVEFIELRDAWYTRLLKSKSTYASKVRIHDDATALARLEWINYRRLDQSRHRLVLITGDSAIHRSARAYTPIERESLLRGPLPRHPRAYLAEPGVLSPESSQTPGSAESKLLDWLDTFLAECYSRGTSYRAKLDELLSMDDRSLQDLAAPVLEIHPGIVEEFRGAMGKLQQESLPDAWPGRPKEKDCWRSLSDLRQDIETILQRVDDVLRRRVWETWEACFEIVMDDRVRHTGPPGYKAASAFAQSTGIIFRHLSRGERGPGQNAAIPDGRQIGFGLSEGSGDLA